MQRLSMSELGQSRRFGDVCDMSALPPTTAVMMQCRERQKGAITSREQMQQRCRSKLFDHLVGAREHRRRHVQSERLGSLAINHQLVLHRRLHWQVGGLLAFEDAVDVAGSAPERIDGVRPVGDKTASGDEVTERVDRRQSVPSREHSNQIAMNHRRRARRHDHGLHSGSARMR